MDVPLAVEQWYQEHDHYNLSAGTCDPGQMCGHYTQVRGGPGGGTTSPSAAGSPLVHTLSPLRSLIKVVLPQPFMWSPGPRQSLLLKLSDPFSVDSLESTGF